MNKIIIFGLSCVFIFLTAFSCLKFSEEGEMKLEFDPPVPKVSVTTPSKPVGTAPQIPVVVVDRVLNIDGVSVNVHGIAPTLTAKDLDGNTIPVLTG